MRLFLLILSIAFFSIFIGAQITEGVLLLPYWQSLSSVEFYAYYDKFGPFIGQFYTALTIPAALIPIVLSIYCKSIKSNALKHALVSAFFALLFVASFYIYFKGANESFYQASLNNMELKNELVTWGYWHWGRIAIECISLFFLILSVIKIQNTSEQ